MSIPKHFYNNLFRKFQFLHAYMHSSLHTELEATGFDDVRMSYIDVIPYIGESGTRLTELIELQPMPKATLARLINTIHEQGYIEKRRCPDDSRSNLLLIAPKGLALIQHAYTTTSNIEDSLKGLIGQTHFKQFAQSIDQCFHTLALPYPPVHEFIGVDLDNDNIPGKLQLQLNHISAFIEYKVLEKCRDFYFPEMNKIHLTVLLQFTKDGIRASDIAKKENLSKQNVSDICHTLIEKKLIRFTKDPKDKRAQLLLFADQGTKLTKTISDVVHNIEKRIECKLDKKTWKELNAETNRLCILLGNPYLQENKEAHYQLASKEIEGSLKDLYSRIKKQHPELIYDIFKPNDGELLLQKSFIKYLMDTKTE